MLYRLAAVVLLAFTTHAFANTTPQALPFSQNWSNTGLITKNDDWTGVPGITGYKGATLTNATAVDPQTVVADDTQSNVIANQNGSPDDLTAGGIAEWETLQVVGLNGSGTARAPNLVITITTTGHTGVNVAYTLRDLDASNDDAISPVALQYRVGMTGNWTNVPAGFVADATEHKTATKTTNVSAMLPAAADNKAVVQVRIITTDALGADEWIGIDDISITSSTLPSGAGTASPFAVVRGGAVTLTAAITAGTGPASTGLAVACDLTAIGGSATQTLLDDGQNGDAMAGDNLFTFATTVDSTVAFGTKSMVCTVTDAEARSSTFNIGVKVIALCGDGVIEGAETCDDGGTANNDGCDMTCTTEPGWTCTNAPSECTDVDECADNIDDCSPNATCENAPGSYACFCNTGYTGSGMGLNGCADIDECTMDTDDCVAAASCVNTPGSFTCGCPTGYAGDGRTGGTGCADIDECTAGSDDCVAEASCANTAGSFTCTCASGFMGDGKASGTGCADTNECGAAADTCDANASCTNTSGSFTCVCNTGYTGDGMTCADVDECAAGTDNCDANAVCTNSAGSFSCACAPGFSGDGVTCTQNSGPNNDDDDDGGGCCSSSTHPGGVALLVLIVIAGLRRRHRR